MSNRKYNNMMCRVLVLKKTKLSENDLILSFLSEDGSLLRAVAKGARKPSSTFSSRLDLFCISDISVAKGKNLDIVKEARLIEPFINIRSDIDKLSAASCATEFMDKSCQPNLAQANIYPLTVKYLQQIEKIKELHDTYIKALMCAYLIKACSLFGFMPSLTNCVICSQDASSTVGDFDFLVPFSYNNGGILCSKCAKEIQTNLVCSKTLYLLSNLLHNKFSSIVLSRIDKNQLNDVINLVNNWIIYCLDIKLKSLKLYISS